MVDRFVPRRGITRRGVLVGIALVAAPFVVRARPETETPLVVPPDRAFPRGHLLVSPQGLFERMMVDGRPVKLLDASTLAAYRERHLPGAVHVWWQDTMELNTPYYGKVLKPDDGESDQGRRVRFLQRLGIRSTDDVIVYGDTENRSAARVSWFLRFLGLNASVLAGGRAGWIGIGGPLTEQVPVVEESSRPQVTPLENFYLSVDSAAERLGEPRVQLIDIRNADEQMHGPYRDLKIPGAATVPRSALVEASGLIRPASELEQIVTAAGVDLSRELMLIGPTGLDSSIPWLALSLMGAEPVIIVDGGWQEWVDQPGLPLAVVAPGPVPDGPPGQVASVTKG